MYAIYVEWVIYDILVHHYTVTFKILQGDRKPQETMKQATSSQPSQPTTQQTSLIRSSRSQSALVSI